MKARANTSPRIGAVKRRASVKRARHINAFSNARWPGSGIGSRRRSLMRETFDSVKKLTRRDVALQPPQKEARRVVSVMSMLGAVRNFFSRKKG